MAVSMEETEERYRHALAELDLLGAVLEKGLQEVAGFNAAVARVHVLLEVVRAHLWAAELGLRIHESQKEART